MTSGLGSLPGISWCRRHACAVRARDRTGDFAPYTVPIGHDLCFPSTANGCSGQYERFPRRRLRVRFSIAARVKPRPNISYRHPLLRLMALTGLVLLFEVSAKPPHDGMRRVERHNLWGALAA